MNPLVSVIIPVFNRKEFIAQALNSVFAQEYDNYEIIVVDDGSSVDIAQFIEPYSTRIKYARIRHKGAAYARNAGIKISKGEYLAFLDDDDLFEPGKLHTQVPYLENHPEVGLVYSDCWEFSGKEMNGKAALNLAVGRDFPPDRFTELFFLSPNVLVPSVLVRRKCFDDAGLFDGSAAPHEDGDMFLRIALKWAVKFCDYPSGRYRIHPENISKNRIKMYQALIRSSLKILKSNPRFARVLGDKAAIRMAELYALLGKAYRDKHRPLLAYWQILRSKTVSAQLKPQTPR